MAYTAIILRGIRVGPDAELMRDIEERNTPLKAKPKILVSSYPPVM
jgi:hypothetical protein